MWKRKPFQALLRSSLTIAAVETPSEQKVIPRRTIESGYARTDRTPESADRCEMRTSPLSLLLLFFLLDSTSVADLWGENFLRRSLHHLARSGYNRKLVPWIRPLPSALDTGAAEEARGIAVASEKPECLSSSGAFDGHFSERCALYRDDFFDEGPGVP